MFDSEFSVQAASNSPGSAKEASADVQVSVSADEPVPYQKPVQEDRPADADTKAISPRFNFSLSSLALAMSEFTDCCSLIMLSTKW